jgi:hypothetical protein
MLLGSISRKNHHTLLISKRISYIKRNIGKFARACAAGFEHFCLDSDPTFEIVRIRTNFLQIEICIKKA